MRVLITGAGGMLGRDLVSAAPGDAVVDGRTREMLDIRDTAAVERALGEASWDWVINAAAYTAVDRAESEPEAAYAVNAAAVGSLGAACARRGVRVLHLSTDYVFDGAATQPYSESDAPAPLNAYGRSKLAGEELLRSSGARALIVRTQWLFGEHGRSFPRTMLERARAGRASTVVNDQLGAPTYTRDLASALWALVALDADGVLHLASAGVASWYDVARLVYLGAGADPALVTPCASAEFPGAAARPSHGLLDATRARWLGVAMRRWEDAVEEFVHLLMAGGGDSIEASGGD